MQIKTFQNVEKLNTFAAQQFLKIANDSIVKRGVFTVALSGGSTPKKLYALLTEEPFRSQIEWQKIHFFFGDERCVSKDSEESNYRMVNENLFTKLDISAKNIHRFLTEDTVDFFNSDYPGCGFSRSVNVEKFVDQTALKMEKTIRRIFKIKPDEFPRFDLIFLGLGADGHTASLFPYSQALNETERIAVENWVEELQTWRFTFTFPTINNARNIIFLIAGTDKAETLREVLEGEFQPDKLPSQMVKPMDGKLLFLTNIQ